MEPGLYDCEEELPYICMNGGNDYSLRHNCKDFQLSSKALVQLKNIATTKKIIISYKLVGYETVNLVRKLTSDNQLDIGRKTHITMQLFSP